MRRQLAVLIKKLQIYFLKREARRIKIEINTIYDSSAHSGGKSIVRMLNPELPKLEFKFSEVIKKLSKLDPATPNNGDISL
jgi:hypothetical protein